MSQAINVVINECREIIKQEDGKDRQERINKVLNQMASAGVQSIADSKDPRLAASIFFGGFSTIGIMLHAVDVDKDNVESVMNFIQVVMGMCTNALSKSEEEEEKGGE